MENSSGSIKKMHEKSESMTSLFKAHFLKVAKKTCL